MLAAKLQQPNLCGVHVLDCSPRAGPLPDTSRLVVEATSPGLLQVTAAIFERMYSGLANPQRLASSGPELMPWAGVGPLLKIFLSPSAFRTQTCSILVAGPSVVGEIFGQPWLRVVFPRKDMGNCTQGHGTGGDIPQVHNIPGTSSALTCVGKCVKLRPR